MGDADLARLGGLVRSLSDEDLVRDEPPASVWAGISARVGDAPAGEAAPVTGPFEEAPVAPPPSTERFDEAPVAPPADPLGPGAGVDDTSGGAVPLHARRRRRPSGWLIGAAAAAVALVLVVVGVVAGHDGDDEPVVVASARLEPLPDQPTGDAGPVEARVVEGDDGLELDLALAGSGLPAPDGFYEVWLIDSNVEGMVSLGPARADGRYAVPADVDVAAFPIVDVSVEPPDGLPTHSGVSVLRGTLA